MTDQIGRALRNVKFYRHVDGTGDMVAGALMLLGTLTFVIRNQYLAIGILIVGVLSISALAQRVQVRFVYPRSGYLAYPKQTGRQLWKTLAISLLAVAVFLPFYVLVFFSNPTQGLLWTLPGMSGVIGLTLIVRGIQIRVLRFILQGICSFLLGMILSPWLYLDDIPKLLPAMMAYLLSMGMVIGLSGLVIFIRYLRMNPLPAQEETDEQ